MPLRVRKLTCQSNTDDYCNPIDLNNIFNDDDILDVWIRAGEQPMLPPDDLSWLDEGPVLVTKVAAMMTTMVIAVMAVMITAIMAV